MWLLARTVAVLPLPAMPGIAVAVATAGFMLMLVAAAQFIAARTTINPLKPERASRLLAEGVYRFSRNPIYLADAVLLAAWAVWLREGLAFTGVALFVAYITRFQIEPEEKALAERFGEEYETYRRRVRRWI